MNGESVLNRKFALTMVALATVAIAACGEQLDAGKSCPLLCPEQEINLRDTVIDAIASDTTVLGIPPIGSETFLMLSSHGDSVQTRAIIRFDTLQGNFSAGNGADSLISHIDTAQIVLPIEKPDSAHRPKVPITLEAYNVDTTASDTSIAALAPLFRPSRLLGAKTFAPESLLDTLRIPISPDSVMDRITNGTHLRIGLRLVSSQGYDVRIGTSLNGNPGTLRLKVSPDTAVHAIVVQPISNTPPNESFVAGPLRDYTIVLKGSTSTPLTQLAVGGIPSRRSLFRFNIPSRLLDSTTVVRASLLLTQTPNRGVNPRDSVWVFPVAILASPVVNDAATVLRFVSGGGFLGLDSLRLAPGDSGVRAFQIVGLVRTWHNTTEEISPNAIGMLSGSEAQLPAEIDFFSMEAPAAVRPKLRITYVPQTNIGLPK
jgi:hypothetical protein